MTGMARAVELLGLRACLTDSVMDSGDGLPPSWGIRTTDECLQVGLNIFSFFTGKKLHYNGNGGMSSIVNEKLMLANYSRLLQRKN